MAQKVVLPSYNVLLGILYVTIKKRSNKTPSRKGGKFSTIKIERKKKNTVNKQVCTQMKKCT